MKYLIVFIGILFLTTIGWMLGCFLAWRLDFIPWIVIRVSIVLGLLIVFIGWVTDKSEEENK